MLIAKLIAFFSAGDPVPSRHLIGENLALSQRYLEEQRSLLRPPSDPFSKFRSTDRSIIYHLNTDATADTPWMKAPTWPAVCSSIAE